MRGVDFSPFRNTLRKTRPNGRRQIKVRGACVAGHREVIRSVGLRDPVPGDEGTSINRPSRTGGAARLTRISQCVYAVSLTFGT